MCLVEGRECEGVDVGCEASGRGGIDSGDMVVNAGLLLIAIMLASESYPSNTQNPGQCHNPAVFDIRTHLVVRIGLWLLNQINQVRRP